jgi:hypothetical protein
MLAFNRDYDELHVMITATSLSGPITSAHIHNGALGANGPVIADIESRFVGNGAFFYSTDPLTPTLTDAILGGNAYVNIHTSKNPNGEVRGQITEKPSCPFESAVVNVGGNLLSISITPNPTSDKIVFSIDDATNSYEGSLLTVTDSRGATIINHLLRDNQQSLDVSHLPAGQYVAMWTYGKNRFSLPFIKL